jgi:hypothetical protein
MQADPNGAAFWSECVLDAVGDRSVDDQPDRDRLLDTQQTVGFRRANGRRRHTSKSTLGGDDRARFARLWDSRLSRRR